MTDPSIVISGDMLRALVSIESAIEIVDEAMCKLSSGGIVAPPRWAMPVPNGGMMGLMPGVLADPPRFGIKVLSMFEASRALGLPSHQGVMLLFNGQSGQPTAIIDAAQLTLLRTAAASAVATRALARADSRRLAIIGCGDQAALHVSAISAVRPIDEIHLWNRTRPRAENLAHRLRASELHVTIHDHITQAVASADVICTLTAATQPILMGAWLTSGQHLNLVGSSTAAQQEVDAAAVARSRLFADCAVHCREQAGELRDAIASGAVGSDWIMGEIGQVLLGDVAGRLHPSDITLYKSLGHAAQDLMVAEAAQKALHHPGGGASKR